MYRTPDIYDGLVASAIVGFAPNRHGFLQPTAAKTHYENLLAIPEEKLAAPSSLIYRECSVPIDEARSDWLAVSEMQVQCVTPGRELATILWKEELAQ